MKVSIKEMVDILSKFYLNIQHGYSRKDIKLQRRY